MVAELEVIAEVPTLDQAVVQEFIDRVRGPVLRPDDAGYDAARAVRNGLIDRQPALIVRCSGVADVVDAVNFARDHGLLLSVRGGGHNVAGSAVNDGGLVIDLSAMRGVRVDPGARTVRAQGGATWGDVDRETQLFGLADPGGVVSTTGIGGLTLGGGLGHLRRKHGLSIDNLLSVDIVTADGQMRTRERTREPGPLLGGSGRRRQFRGRHLVRVSSCTQSARWWRSARRSTRWRTAGPCCGPGASSPRPHQTKSIPCAVLWSVPDDEHFPAELRRRPVVILAAVFAGPAAEGERIMQPLREIATPLLDLSGTLPFTALQSAFDPFFPEGRLYYWKSAYVDRLGDDAIDTIVERAAVRPSHLSTVTFWHLGGAIARVDSGATAYVRRDAPFLFAAEASWTDPAETDRNIAWSRESLVAMRPFSEGGLYVNFPGFGEEKEALVRAGLRRQLRPLGRPQDPIRPNQPVPDEPEHQAGGLKAAQPRDRRGAARTGPLRATKDAPSPIANRVRGRCVRTATATAATLIRSRTRMKLLG